MTQFTRRQTLALGLAGTGALFLPAIARAQSAVADVRNNVSSFQMQDWRDHFDSLGKGVIRGRHRLARAALLGRGRGRAPHLPDLGPDVGRADQARLHRDCPQEGRPVLDADRRRRCSVTPTGSRFPPGRKTRWAPMRCICAWPAYIIHGTHDTRKIGRRSSDGCIGLYNENIAELFALCPVGTQVRVI